MATKEEFIKNYTGIYNPGKYYDYLQQKKQNEANYNGATFNKTENARMLKEANEASFNKHLRKKS